VGGRAIDRITLVNPPGVGSGASYTVPNVGLGYVASAFRAAGWEVRYLDGFVDGGLDGVLRGCVDAHASTVFGIYATTPFLDSVRRIAEHVRREHPGALLLAGGPHPSAVPAETLAAIPALDAVVVGEVEGAFPELGRFLSGRASAGEVPGLWTRDAGAGAPRRQCDPDDNPIPAWELLRPRSYRYRSAARMQRHAVATSVVLTRGCPYRCAYCSAHAVAGSTVRTRSIDNILRELTMLRDRYGIDEIQVMDDALTADRAFALRLCTAIRDADLGLTFSTPNGVRLDTLDDELLAALEGAGFYRISVGIESGSQRRLDALGKGLTLERIRRDVGRIKRVSSLSLTGHFILGFPGETVEEAEQTIEFACELPLDLANFTDFLMLPGSELAARSRAPSDDWVTDAASGGGSGWAAYSRRRQRALRLRAYARFYGRPRVLRQLVGGTSSLHHLLPLAPRIRTSWSRSR